MTTKTERYSVLTSIAPDLLETLGGIGRSLGRDVRNGKFHRLLNVVINPKGYSDWQEFYRDYQAYSLLKKYPALPLPINRVQVAVDKFLQSEKICNATNQKFRYLTGKFSHPALCSLEAARSVIAKILGDFSWDVALQYCDFGPGSNVGVPRRDSHLCKKIGKLNPTVTGDCLPLLSAYVRYDPHVGDLANGYSLVRGSKSTTVPKDARTDRFIAIEPQWNLFFQKGIGGMIRRRLRVAGIDLDNGQPVNQRLALQGSVDGRLATIDLSAASDTISHSLVEFLLPPKWYEAMKTVRSPYTLMPDGSSVLLRKFSSMGNGFTFELESLIFYALVKAITPSGKPGLDVSVFGDDIILPSADAAAFIGLLSEIGFTTNKEKSFVDGPFRESCGKHYFMGRDVTPFYLKKEIRSYHDLLWFINNLRRLSFRYLGLGYGCHGAFEGVWRKLISMLPRRLQFLSCPDGYGDDAILRDFDECTPKPRTTGFWVEGYTSKALAASYGEVEHEDLPGLISKLWFTRRELPLGLQSQYVRIGRNQTLRLRIQKRVYAQWSTLGPWVG